MIAKMCKNNDVPKHSPFKKNIQMYTHHLFIEDQWKFINYLLTIPLLQLQY